MTSPITPSQGGGERRAPVQGYSAGIPWSMHLRAYDAYCKKYRPQKALIEGGCRGGFGVGELDMFIPGWREELSEIATLKARIEELQSDLAETTCELDAFGQVSPQQYQKELATNASRIEEQDKLLAEAADYLNAYSSMDGADIGFKITAYRLAQQKSARALLASKGGVK